MSLAAVVIHFGPVAHTAKFVQSVVGGHPSLDLYVVNNGPATDAELRSALGGSIQIVGPPINRGYPKAANCGIELAIADHHTDVVILPNDGIIPDGALHSLHRTADAHDSTVTGPLVLYHGSRASWANGLHVSKRWGVVRNVDKGQISKRVPTTEDIDFVTGHVILLRGIDSREWLRFDEDMFIYYEDVAICTITRSRDERVMIDRGTVVYHDKPGESSYRFAATQERHLARSGLVYWAKYVAPGDRVLHLLGYLALTVYRVARAANLSAAAAGVSGVLSGTVAAVRYLRGHPIRPAHR